MKLSLKSHKPKHVISYECPKCEHAYLTFVFSMYKDRDLWACEKCETQYVLVLKEVEERS